MNPTQEEFDPALHSSLYINGQLKLWGDKRTIRGYLTTQTEEWQWLSNIDERFRSIHSYLFGILSDAKLSTEIEQCMVSIGSHDTPYIDAFSDLGLYIKTVLENHGKLVAGFFTIYCIPYNRSKILNTLGETLKTLTSEHFYENSLAVQLSIKREIDITDTDNTPKHLNLTQCSATANLISEIESSRARISRTEDELLTNFDNRKKDFTESFQTAALFNQKRLSRYRQLTKKTIQWAAKKIALAESDWEAKKARLKEQLEIKESITYWEEREESHNNSKNIWLTSIFLIMISTIMAMHFSAQSFLEDLHIKSLNIGDTTQEHRNEPSPPATPPTTVKKTIEGIGSLNLNIDAETFIMLIIKLAGTILILTFSGILLKIALRQYSNNVALSTNASERLAFIKTYLALMDEGKLDGREDRNLVLQALFRTSAIAISDIPVTTPIEILLKNS